MLLNPMVCIYYRLDGKTHYFGWITDDVAVSLKAASCFYTVTGYPVFLGTRDVALGKAHE